MMDNEIEWNHLNPIYSDPGSSFCLHGLWPFLTLFISELKPLNLATFPKIYLKTIWHSKSLSNKFDVTTATTLAAFFQNFELSPFLVLAQITLMHN